MDQNQPPQHPGQPMQPHPAAWVDADPESAGLRRVEKPGFGILVAAVGTVTVVVSFFLGWFRVTSYLSEGYLEREGLPTETFAADEREWPTPFAVVDTVKDLSGQGLDPHDPGVFAGLVYPWLLVVLTLLCVLLAGAAAMGARRRSRTLALRLTAPLVLVVTAGTAALGWYDLGVGDMGMTYADGPESASSVWTSWKVHPDVGAVVWGVGMLLLAIAAALGPRISHRLPDGGAAGPATTGWAPVATAPLRVTTTTAAIVGAAIGAVLCFAGYGFLPWGEDTTFSDIGEAAREYGFDDKPLTEAYFAWLGWAILALTVVALAALALGRTAMVSATVMRPILALTSIGAGAVHGWVWADLASDGGELEVGAYAVALGLLLVIIGASAPLRTTARVMVAPSGPPPHGPPPAGPPPAGPPPAV